VYKAKRIQGGGIAVVLLVVSLLQLSYLFELGPRLGLPGPAIEGQKGGKYPAQTGDPNKTNNKDAYWPRCGSGSLVASRAIHKFSHRPVHYGMNHEISNPDMYERGMVELRPALGPALDRLIAALCRMPTLRPRPSSAIVTVALGAHGTSVASVRVLLLFAASVIIERQPKRIELGLRPAFFVHATPGQRLSTLCHELLHLDDNCTSLRPEHRHDRLPHLEMERQAQALAHAFLATPEGPKLAECLAHHGEVWMPAWLHRPIDATVARRFTNKDIMKTPVAMTTAAGERSGWW
jgi:hypothetical protein